MAHAAVAAVLAAEPVPGLKGASAFVLIAGVVVVVAAVAVIPLIMDVRRATAWRQQLTDQLIDRAGTDPEVRDFLRDLREPRGVRGLTRTVIAILILALVGFALAVAMLSSGADSGDLRKTIVTSLMTVLATVAGFYFGSLGAQNSAEDARRHAARPAAKSASSPSPAAGKGAAGAAAGHVAAASVPGATAVAVAEPSPSGARPSESPAPAGPPAGGQGEDSTADGGSGKG